MSFIIRNYLRITKKLNEKIAEKLKHKHPILFYDFCIENCNVDKLKENEEFIASCGECSYKYSYYVIKGRWIPGEKAISKNPCYSYWYANNVIKGRFELGEEAISKNANYYYWYTKDVINRYGA